MNRRIQNISLQELDKMISLLGGSSLCNPVRPIIHKQFYSVYYTLYEEDISNLLCQTNTIITKN
jgi:hypothetical protein